jgi:hypothetical protein
MSEVKEVEIGEKRRVVWKERMILVHTHELYR